jgi:beta-lysine 5,6-aminomutase beta subunit
VEIVEAEGRRKDVILTCGGPRVSDELAKELGFDAGFSKGTYPHHVASFIVRELAERIADNGHAARTSGERVAGDRSNIGQRTDG